MRHAMTVRHLVLPLALVSVVAGFVACGSDGGGGGGGVDPGVPDGSTPTDEAGVTPPVGDGGSADVQADAPEPPYTGPKALSVAASDSGACAISTGGVLQCWGRGVASPETVMAGTSFAKVTLGEADGGSTCAIDSTGKLWCWTVGAPTPVEVTGGPWAEAAIGKDQRCAITTAGTLFCWGTNTYGQLGVGDANPRTDPTQVGTDTDWKLITAGENGTCAIKTNGKLSCWGRLGSGNDQLSSNTPVAVEPQSDFIDVWLFGLNRVGIRADGAMLYGAGQTFAVTTTTTKFKKARLGGSSSSLHRCGLDDGGSIFCIGANQRGQLGDGTQLPAHYTAPVRAGAVGEWLDVAVGTRFSCGIRKDGAVRCWGAATNGQLGRGGPIGTRTTPSQVGTDTDWVAVDANQARTCGGRANGTVSCWGAGASTTPGLDAQVPAQHATGGYTGVALGLYHQCVRKNDGSLACWGSNSFGECGTGSTTPPNVTMPTAVALSAKTTSAGISHTCAIDQADHVFCWGNHLYNQLGFTSAVDVPTPTQVGTETWTKVASTYSNNCAIRTDGALFCFGFSFTDFEQIGTDTGWTALATTPNDNLYWGIRAGVPYTWSGNGGSKVPGALTGAGATPWTAIAANFSRQCGVRSDGTMICGSPPTFAQVGTDTDWKAVAVGYSHSCAIKTNGTMWCWGANGSGEIGDGTSWSTAGVTVQL